jgi:hypothetical protein
LRVSCTKSLKCLVGTRTVHVPERGEPGKLWMEESARIFDERLRRLSHSYRLTVPCRATRGG